MQIHNFYKFIEDGGEMLAPNDKISGQFKRDFQTPVFVYPWRHAYYMHTIFRKSKILSPTVKHIWIPFKI